MLINHLSNRFFLELIEEFEKNDKVGLNILLKICKILVDCKMLRLNSDIKCYYILCVDKYGLKLKDADDEIKIRIKIQIRKE